MRIKSLSHAGLTVKDFNRAVRWYWNTFRLPLVSVSELEAAEVQRLHNLYRLPPGVSLKLGFLRCPGGAVLELFQFSETDEWDHSWNRPGVQHLTLDVRNAARWYDKLERQGDVELLCEVQHTGGADWFFFRDPDGNLIELIDLKFNYFALRIFGAPLGWLLRRFVYRSYYAPQ